MSAHRIEIVEDRRDRDSGDRERFDRVAFALAALRRLEPTLLTVAVYVRSSGLHVECSRDLRRGPLARWATIGIPPQASRAEISLALAELVGLAHVPYVTDLLQHTPDTLA